MNNTNIEHFKIAVLGGGSWGTAIVKILTENGHQINWYVKNPQSVAHIREYKRNPKYLKSVIFNTDKINVNDDLSQIVSQSDVLILAIPSFFLKENLDKIKPILNNKIILSAVKGMIEEETITSFLHKKFNIPLDNLGIIGGPCHAEEVAKNHITYVTVASYNEDVSKSISPLFNNKYVLNRIASDTLAIEYANVLKNIYAISTGIAKGLGYGDNFQSVLITNCYKEMRRFLKKIIQVSESTNKSVYLGDLLVTTYSAFSRNKLFGMMIARGYSINSIHLELNMVAEGYYSINSIIKILEKKEIKAPIISAVYEILYKNKKPSIVFQELAKELI